MTTTELVAGAVGSVLTIATNFAVNLIKGKAESKKVATEADVNRMQAVAQIERQEFDFMQAGGQFLLDLLEQERSRADEANARAEEAIKVNQDLSSTLAETNAEIKILRNRIEHLEEYIQDLKQQLQSKPCRECKLIR